MKEKIKRIHYFRAGTVERGAMTKHVDGYSQVIPDGGTTQPWLTMREAQEDAGRQGGRAFFFETEAHARAAIARQEK